jgi:hypothetical protein
MDAWRQAGLKDLMRFALGLVLLFVIGAFAVWGLWNLYRPKKRGPGLTIGFGRNRRRKDDDKGDDPEDDASRDDAS